MMLTVLTVAILYVVAAGINSTGGLDYVLNKILGQPKTLAMAQLRLILPVSFVSAFLNNTPVVAVMIPIVQRWAARIQQPVSQLFIPLSFASILGGTCTLIGTSTNLVIAGQYESMYNDTLSLFGLGSVGVPVLLFGTMYVVLFAPFLLPDFKELSRRDSEGSGDIEGETFTREIGADFTVSCVVLGMSALCEKAVGDSCLRGNDVLYLTSVERQDRLFNAVSPEFVIHEGDILFFTGIVDAFDEFCIQNGFRIVTHGDSQEDELSFKVEETRSHDVHFDDRLVKVMIRTDSVLVGKTPQEIHFRKRYDAAIVSLSRVGEQLTMRGNLGQMVFQVGDILLLLTGDTFNLNAWTRDLKPLMSDNATMQQALDEHANEKWKSVLSSVAEREFMIPMRVVNLS